MHSPRVVLITGASSGFGQSIAVLLHQHGYKVFGTSRRPDPKSQLNLLKLDVNSEKSVDACISEVIDQEGRIDVLVNNAGYVSSGALEENSIKDARLQFETNFFGAVRMVDGVLPVMRRQKEGKIINISSLVSLIPVPFEGFYAASKAALSSYSESLWMELKSLNIKVSVIEPGFFNTGLFTRGKAPSKRIQDYAKDRERVSSRFRNNSRKGGDPQEMARTILKITSAKNPKLHYHVGSEKNYLIAKKILPSSAFSSAVAGYWGLGKA